MANLSAIGQSISASVPEQLHHVDTLLSYAAWTACEELAGLGDKAMI